MSIGNTPTLPLSVTRRPLNFFWLVDWSGSMMGKKISALNTAVREAVEEVKSAITAHPEVEVLMRAIRFSNRAEWHVGPQPVPIDQFSWPTLGIDGATSTSQAINLLCDALDVNAMPQRGFPPVCILVSDGFCTDGAGMYDAAIQRLNSLPWGKKAVRLAVAVGDPADYDEGELLKFVNADEVGLLKATKPEDIVHYIKWASVSASVSASMSRSSTNAMAQGKHVILPPPPNITSSSDIF